MVYLANEKGSEERERNGIEIVRLKDKMGTRQLPTGELIVRGSHGLVISEKKQGIKMISNMLNVTRIHNAVSSISFMRRIITLAFDYSQRRRAFGKLLSQHHLHIHTIQNMDYVNRGCLSLLLQVTLFLQAQDASLKSA